MRILLTIDKGKAEMKADGMVNITPSLMRSLLVKLARLYGDLLGATGIQESAIMESWPSFLEIILRIGGMNDQKVLDSIKPNEYPIAFLFDDSSDIARPVIRKEDKARMISESLSAFLSATAYLMKPLYGKDELRGLSDEMRAEMGIAYRKAFEHRRKI